MRIFATILNDYFRMAIISKIRNWFGWGANNVPNMADYSDWRVCGGGRAMPTHNYRNVLFFQFVKLIGNLFYDTTLSYSNSSKAFRRDFDAFLTWFDKYAFYTYNYLCFNGFCVIAKISDVSGMYFKTLKTNEYVINDYDGKVKPQISGVTDWYTITSDTFDCFGNSDYSFLFTYLRLAEKYLNNSDLAIDGNGHILFVAPQAENQHTNTVLTPEQREKWVREMTEEGKFKDAFVHPYWSNRPIDVRDVDLTNFDTANFDKLIKVMLIVCGHFDLPPSQVPLLQSEASRSGGLSNGGEILAGDLLKYKAFERVLQKFVLCANHFGLEVDYTIANNPNDLNNNNLTPTL